MITYEEVCSWKYAPDKIALRPLNLVSKQKNLSEVLMPQKPQLPQIMTEDYAFTALHRVDVSSLGVHI
jgi:hypothetical protein